MPDSTNRITKRIEIAAPISRVWRALTDYREFGEWFRVKLEGPFVPGEQSRGMITWPGYEHVVWKAVVQRMEPESLFSFTWEPEIGYRTETPNLVEFRLEKTETGTLLTVTESGFDNIPFPAPERARGNSLAQAQKGRSCRLADSQGRPPDSEKSEQRPVQNPRIP